MNADDFTHDFNCITGCLLCIRCGIHMKDALESAAPCGDRVRRHPHPLPERARIPYVPEWAIPLGPAR